MTTQLRLGEHAVDVVLKDIKSVNLSVYPRTDSVRISAPKWTKIGSIRVFAISKLGWTVVPSGTRHLLDVRLAPAH